MRTRVIKVRRESIIVARSKKWTEDELIFDGGQRPQSLTAAQAERLARALVAAAREIRGAPPEGRTR